MFRCKAVRGRQSVAAEGDTKKSAMGKAMAAFRKAYGDAKGVTIDWPGEGSSSASRSARVLEKPVRGNPAKGLTRRDMADLRRTYREGRRDAKASGAAYEGEDVILDSGGYAELRGNGDVFVHGARLANVAPARRKPTRTNPAEKAPDNGKGKGQGGARRKPAPVLVKLPQPPAEYLRRKGGKYQVVGYRTGGDPHHVELVEGLTAARVAAGRMESPVTHYTISKLDEAGALR